MLSTSQTLHANDRSARSMHAAEGRGLSGAFEMFAAPMNFGRDEEIYGEGEPAEYLYQVVRGAVRTTKMLEDGRRQIGAFYRPGDFFGLEAGDEHSFSAEAICNSVVRLAKRSSIVAMASRDTTLASELWTSTARSLRVAQEHMLLLGRKTAEERLASFLLSLAGAPANGQIVVELPMSRQDIADYLGLTIETVSRTFTKLEDNAAIELPSSRRIVVRSPSGLQRLNG
ncbi:MAG TPA: helix-turn-helix domain-containing protein [Bauldia sp.]|nr:helix-turn-helix domain-containing protein [Bauldia sp.]